MDGSLPRVGGLAAVKLETLAALKRGATDPKSRLVLAMLEETIRRRGR